MQVTNRGTRKHGKYQLHVSTWQVPNFIEKWILFKRPRVVNYVGKGTKWFIMYASPVHGLQYKPLKNKTLLKWLQTIHP